MGFKSIIVSPVIRPDQDYTRRELWHLKQEIKRKFTLYGISHCNYLLLIPESSFYGYDSNFAIIDFKTKESAEKALRAVETGTITINKQQITARPLHLRNTPINILPDNCLLEIFNNLSTYEQLKLSGVCKRWADVSRQLWRKTTRIDLRENTLVHKNKQYLINSGSHLKEIYCYDDHGFKTITDHCRNVENMALEFRKYTKRKGLDQPCIRYERQALQQFSRLTRLLLKIRIPQYTYFSFLQELPRTIIEIHLFNDLDNSSTTEDRWLDREARQAKISEKRNIYGRKTLDLSGLSNIQALTLNSYHLDDDSVIGLERLKKLSHLNLDKCYLSKHLLGKLETTTNLEHLSLKLTIIDYDDMCLILKRNDHLKYLCLPLITDWKDARIWLRALRLEHLKVLCWNDADNKIRESSGASTTIEYIEHHNVGLSDRRTRLMLENFPNLKVFKRTGWWGSSSDWFISDVKQIVLARPNKAPMRYYHNSRYRRSDERYIPWENHSSDNFEHNEVVSTDDAKILRCNEWDGWYIQDSPAAGAADEELKSQQEVKSKGSDDPQESTCPSTIQELSDDSLNTIFHQLSLDNKLKAAEDCNRWKMILEQNWESCKKFDVRELSCHESRERCMIKWGKYFEEIYTYKSCGFSWLRDHCPNVKSLGLDFRVKKCKCKPLIRKERYSLRSLQPILMRLKHLTHIMLRDAPVFQSDFLENLPEGMREIHVFNRSHVRLGEHSQEEDSGVTSDLITRREISMCKYRDLRALTLVEAQAITQPYELSRKNPVKISGLENLEELIYLRMNGVAIAGESDNPLGDVKKLEYLSMPLSALSSENFQSLIGNNRHIEYLDISDDFNGVSISKLMPVFTLERLRYLRAINIPSKESELEGFKDLPQEIHFDGLQNLEIIDCQGSGGISNDLFLRILGCSLHLRVASVRVTEPDFAEELIAIAESNVMARWGRSPDIRLFLGVEGFRLCNNLELQGDGVVLSDVPHPDYYSRVEKNYWEGWRTMDGGRTTAESISGLLNVFDN
ncbi:uncharacterized protein [Fopius arisanus]|uniref:F-box domain-containing protein n=2 Tax=Fopius arisanus TaxID=64838 RepID=A0A9R1U727_9HYME|nr:PREDICTED: uncharacterized protein LOC105270445 [Fopius arisanus]